MQKAKKYIIALGCVACLLWLRTWYIYRKNHIIQEETSPNVTEYSGETDKVTRPIMSQDIANWDGKNQRKESKPWRPPSYAFPTNTDDGKRRTAKDTTKFKHILVWNGDNQMIKNMIGSDRFSKCPYRNCEFTDRRSFLDRSDAVLFLTFALRDFVTDQPPYRRPDQPWILGTREPPWEILRDLKNEFDNKFNIMMHYRTDAEVVYTYGYLQELTEQEQERVVLKKNYASHKTGLVCWFVSHCRTDSLREIYAKELQNHVNLDVYGTCGHLHCGATGIHNYNTSCVRIKQRYKFYLSFENSLCADYITEKLWWALEEDLVPIVMGGSDYSKFLPDGSYIDVRNFSSPRALADYIKMLDNNDELYNQYFTWKKKYKVSFDSGRFCQLCAVLNTKSYGNKTYGDLRKWLDGCDKTVDYFKQVADDIVNKIKHNLTSEEVTF